jgi:DNA polymerase III alpha subunit
LDDKINHKLVLLAINLESYQNIISLISKASLNNPGTLAKINFDDLKELKKEKNDLGIIALS